MRLVSLPSSCENVKSHISHKSPMSNFLKSNSVDLNFFTCKERQTDGMATNTPQMVEITGGNLPLMVLEVEV